MNVQKRYYRALQGFLWGALFLCAVFCGPPFVVGCWIRLIGQGAYPLPRLSVQRL